MTDPRLERPAWRGRTNVDALTAACIEHAETIGGHEFVVTQGSYQSGVAASAGTHDQGGVVDLRWCGHARCVKALRQAGMAAWHRSPAQGPWVDHVHAVVIDHPLLAPAAMRQVLRYLAGRNGLANDADDDGPRLNPIPRPVWPWPPVEDDMFTDEDRADLKAARKAAERAREGSYKRDRALIELARQSSEDVDAILAKLNTEENQ